MKEGTGAGDITAEPIHLNSDIDGEKLAAHLISEANLDPLLLMCLCVRMDCLSRDTYIGDRLLHCVSTAIHPFGLCADRIAEAVEKCRKFFCATPHGVLGISKMKKVRSLADHGRHRPVVFTHAKKKAVIAQLVAAMDKCNIDYAYPVLLQVVSGSGARTHRLFVHVRDAVVYCRDALLNHHGMSDILQIVEVSIELQAMVRFYLDVDLLTSRLEFLEGMPHRDRRDFVRNLCTGIPSLVTRLLVHMGALEATDHVQVAVVEGTRWNRAKGCHKCAWHLVWNLLLTREQYVWVWRELICMLEDPGLDIAGVRGENALAAELFTESEAPVTRNGADRMGDWLCLLGLDPHPAHNLEQGLAIPFSRKNEEDPYSRPMQILHLCGHVEMYSEIPDKTVWTAWMPIDAPRPSLVHLDPVKVANALVDTMIGVPSARCIGMKRDVPSPRCHEATGIIGRAGGRDDPSLPYHKGAGRSILPSRVVVNTKVRQYNTPFFSTTDARGEETRMQHISSTVPLAAPHPPTVQYMGFGKLSLRIQHMAGLLQKRGNSAVSAKNKRKRNMIAGTRSKEEEEAVARGPARRKARQFVEGDADGPTRQCTKNVPGWLDDILSRECPEYVDKMYLNPKYGSLPSHVARQDVQLLFQLNGCTGCLCAHSAMRVPFAGYDCHSSNGVLFCIVGEEVYISCMSSTCRDASLSNRERYCSIAMVLEEQDHKRRWDRIQSAIKHLPHLRTQDHELLVKAKEWTGADVKAVCRIPSVHMLNSRDEKRSWLLLSKELLEDYFQSRRARPC